MKNELGGDVLNYSFTLRYNFFFFLCISYQHFYCVYHRNNVKYVYNAENTLSGTLKVATACRMVSHTIPDDEKWFSHFNTSIFFFIFNTGTTSLNSIIGDEKKEHIHNHEIPQTNFIKKKYMNKMSCNNLYILILIHRNY